MTASVHTVDKSTQTLRDVKALLNKEKIRHVPVMAGNKLCVIISKNDINRLSFGAIFENQANADEAILDMLSIEQVMSAHPRVVSSDTSIKEVAEILAVEDFHSLPVVDNDEVVGIVTSTDVIKYMLEQY
jgi:CBS domain-containing protein